MHVVTPDGPDPDTDLSSRWTGLGPRGRRLRGSVTRRTRDRPPSLLTTENQGPTSKHRLCLRVGDPQTGGGPPLELDRVLPGRGARLLPELDEVPGREPEPVCRRTLVVRVVRLPALLLLSVDLRLPRDAHFSPRPSVPLRGPRRTGSPRAPATTITGRDTPEVDQEGHKSLAGGCGPEGVTGVLFRLHRELQT